MLAGGRCVGKHIAEADLADSLNVRLQLAREIAATARDAPEKRGDDALVNQWREVSKVRKQGAIPPQPAGSKIDFPDLFQQWLKDRGLDDALEFAEEKEGWRVYRYTREPVVESQPDWESAFHGTWWYAVWLILHTGIFLESSDKDLGHDFWEPGVYCSPELDTGIWYARPQIMFGDDVFQRIIFEVKVDRKRQKQNRKRGGVQWVFPCGAISLHAVWVRSNAPPANGEERVNGWQPELEALPPGCSALPAVVNPRTEPWPALADNFAWDFDGDSSAPPWLRGNAQPKKKPAQDATTLYGKHALGGLYGRWLAEVPQLQSGKAWSHALAALSNSSKTKCRGSLGRSLEKKHRQSIAQTMLAERQSIAGSGLKPGWLGVQKAAAAKAAAQRQQPAAAWAMNQQWPVQTWDQPDEWGALDPATLAAIAQVQMWGWDGPPAKKSRWW